MSTSMSPECTELAAVCLPSSSTSVEDRRLLTRSLLAQRLVRLRACREGALVKRRKREMIHVDMKDATYWHKRRKNNEAAKRSREKRKLDDLLLGDQLVTLSGENAQLWAQMLNLHYHTNMNMEKHKPVSPLSVMSLSLSPMPTHCPALLQAELWDPIAAAATHRFETSIPCFSSSRGAGMFNHLNHHYLLNQPEPHPISHGGVLGDRRHVGVEMNAQQQLSSSDEIPFPNDAYTQRLSSLPTFLPMPDALQHASAVQYPPLNWVVPHLNHAAACNHLLTWRSSYLAKPTTFPRLLAGWPDQGVGVEEHFQRGL